jgi:indole-3-glycerol phosphate synthase
MNILERIVNYKRKEVASANLLIPKSELEQMTDFGRATIKMTEFLLHPDRTGIIAEFKRRSPSKGIINDQVSVEEVTQGYSKNGASALSVLTDFHFFGGSVEDLMSARKVNQIPILRKEFIIDEYQIYEAKAIGADAILLIAAILEKKQAKKFAKIAKELGLQVLMELHDESELDLLNDHIDIVGVNNRNLKTFIVDLKHSVKLAEKIPDHFIKISESGISSPDDIFFLKQHGFKGFLIGENFMKTENPGLSFSSFVESLQIAQQI